MAGDDQVRADSSRAPAWIAGGLLAAATAAVYSNSLSCPFVFDDRWSITDNPSIRNLSRLGAVLAPPSQSGTGGRPLLNLSFAINYAFGGTSVAGYHAVNIAIHSAAALALFGVARRTLLLPSLRSLFGRAALPLGALIAALWALHPLQTEAVTYVSERAESLMGLFYLLTLYGFIQGLDVAGLAEAGSRGHRPRLQALWFAISWAACLLGMLTKEVMATAPVVVLLYDRTFVAGTFREAWRKRWRFHLALMATWIPLAFLMAGLRERGVAFNEGVAWPVYARIECEAILRYLRLAVMGHPLVFDYGFGPRLAPALAKAIPMALAVALLVAASVGALFRPDLPNRPRPGLRALGFCGVWVFAILAPTSSVFPITGQPIAEHRMYLPLAGVAGIAVCAAYVFGGRRSFAVLALAAAALGWGSHARNEDYRSNEALWSDVVSKRPENPRGYASLGEALGRDGQVDKAIALELDALKIEPNYPQARSDLGFALDEQGKRQEAIAQFEWALRFKPDDADTRYNLANTLGKAGRSGDAIAQYEQALQIQPDFPEAEFNLGNALRRANRLPEAILHYEDALRLKPDDPGCLNNLGMAEALSGNAGQAETHFEEALKLRPDFPDARRNLALVLRMMDGAAAQPSRSSAGQAP